MKKVLLSGAAVLALSATALATPAAADSPRAQALGTTSAAEVLASGRQRVRQELEGLRHPRGRRDRRAGRRPGLRRWPSWPTARPGSRPSPPPTRPSACWSRTSAARRSTSEKRVVSWLAKNAGIDTIETVLLYHVVPGRHDHRRPGRRGRRRRADHRAGRHAQGQGQGLGQGHPGRARRPGPRRLERGGEDARHQQGQPADHPRHQPRAAPGRPLRTEPLVNGPPAPRGAGGPSSVGLTPTRWCPAAWR